MQRALNVGGCGIVPVDKALNSRSKGLRYDSRCWLCVEVFDIVYTASTYPAFTKSFQVFSV